MKKIIVNLKTDNTTIYFDNVFSSLENLCLKGKKVVIFATKKAENLVNEIIDFLVKKDIDVYSFLTSDGEDLKDLKKALLLTDFLILNNISRNDILINIGGGTVCDLGAFVASLYMRGISYINIPTTLLCAVDASIGGKTAIDYGNVKNIWGTFYQPTAVIEDVNLIKDSGEDVLKEGLSEVVKYAIINKDFGKKLELLMKENSFYNNLDDVIYQCAKIKAHFVEIDEFDKGERHCLNLGHTIAHAIESESLNKTTHSKAVALGLIKESEIAFKLGVLNKENYDNIINFCLLFFNYNEKLDVNNLIKFMVNDKKNKEGKIGFSLPTDSGVKTFYLGKEEILNLL